ncbi:hypothetical protein XENTR_v10015695 [Xenopus tropicalis]|nr:hypothetical protein XENTR_v10015695 [Xenopus tropicalis]
MWLITCASSLYRMPQWAPGEGSCPSCRYRDVTHIPDRSGACATQPKIWALTGALEMNGIYGCDPHLGSIPT